MDRFEPIKFEKLSEAIAYLEDGGYLCQLDGGHAYEIDDFQVLAIHWRGPLHTKAKPTPWYEKLDGTADNGVLCLDSSGRTALIVERHSPSGDLIDEWGNDIDTSRPLTRAEIQRFMDNAPEE